jgi:hypothetical protein
MKRDSPEVIKILQEYYAARADFDLRLSRERSLHELVTRKDWINEK